MTTFKHVTGDNGGTGTKSVIVSALRVSARRHDKAGLFSAMPLNKIWALHIKGYYKPTTPLPSSHPLLPIHSQP